MSLCNAACNAAALHVCSVCDACNACNLYNGPPAEDLGSALFGRPAGDARVAGWTLTLVNVRVEADIGQCEGGRPRCRVDALAHFVRLRRFPAQAHASICVLVLSYVLSLFFYL